MPKLHFQRNPHNKCVWNAVRNILKSHFGLINVYYVTDAHRTTTVSLAHALGINKRSIHVSVHCITFEVNEW